jgi:hypothetical protein
MRIIGTFAVGLALVSGTSLAQAQTAVSRQITSEPVETVIIQGPNGTVVTRRILTPEPGVSAYVPPDYPVAVPAVEPQYVAPAAPALVPRRTITEERARTTRRTAAVTRPAPARPARTVTGTATRTIAAPVSDQPLALSPVERQVIYRTVVPREVYPAPVVAPPPVLAPTGLYAPRAVYPADDDYYQDRDYAYDPGYGGGYRADPYYAPDYRDPYHPEYRRVGVPLAVGARVPPNIQLVAVPEPIVARVPAARPYSYARYGDRVYLVDPATGIIVADITQ